MKSGFPYIHNTISVLWNNKILSYFCIPKIQHVKLIELMVICYQKFPVGIHSPGAHFINMV